MNEANKESNLDAEQQVVIDELNALRAKLAVPNDTEFHKRYLSSYMSYSTWFRLNDGNYNGKIEKYIDCCRQVIENITELLASRTYLRPVQIGEFYRLNTFEAVFESIKEAQERPDNKRLVIFLAETGFGKSAVCEQLHIKYNATLIESSEVWRSSYFACVKDVCAALGSAGPWKSVAAAQEWMLNQMNKKVGVLGIDEANSFGPHSCNLVKMILNRTPWVVFIGALPGLFNMMTRKSWFEASQMLRRAIAVIHHADIKPVDVSPFVSELKFAEPKAALPLIAGAGNKFGGYDTIKEIRTELLDSFGTDEDIPTPGVEKAIAITLGLKVTSKHLPRRRRSA